MKDLVKSENPAVTATTGLNAKSFASRKIEIEKKTPVARSALKNMVVQIMPSTPLDPVSLSVKTEVNRRSDLIDQGGIPGVIVPKPVKADRVGNGRNANPAKFLKVKGEHGLWSPAIHHRQTSKTIGSFSKADTKSFRRLKAGSSSIR